MIKKLWIKWFGQTSYCRWFHVATSTENSPNWRCECGNIYPKRLSDNDTGPL